MKWMSRKSAWTVRAKQPRSAAVPESSTNNSNAACEQGEDPHKAVEQPQEGEAVSASDNPEIKSQVLQSDTPNAKRQKSTLSERLHLPGSLAPVTPVTCSTLVSCAPWNAKAIKPSAFSPALDGLSDLRDPFQHQLVRHEASPLPQAQDPFVQDEVHYSCLGKSQHRVLCITHNLD